MLRIASHEFRYMFFSLQTMVITCLFFGVAFLFTANGIEFQGAARGGNVFVNSPYEITKFLILLSLLVAFITPSYIASAVLKDVDSKFDAILFSMPVTKSSYIFGRFLGAFAAMMVALSAGPVGMFLGAYWPWAAPGTLAPNDISHYLYVFFGFVLPSVFTTSAVIFAVAVISRSMLLSYFAALGLIILFVTVDTSTPISSIWDPFMGDAFAEQTRYWTAAERNSNLLGYSGVILANRLVWFGVAVGFFSLAFLSIFISHTEKSCQEQSRPESEGN